MRILTEFRVQCRAEMEERINSAIAAAHCELSDRSGGILVTRHTFDHFSVAVVPHIPFGLIYEQDLAL